MKHVDFRDLKGKVGITDVAYHLGYKIDRKAGVGKYIEMISATGEDKIVIKNTADKAAQTFFRRNGAGAGDVITFVQENLNVLGGARGDNKWMAVKDVLCKLSNTPIEDNSFARDVKNGQKLQKFEQGRFSVLPVRNHEDAVQRFFEDRKINKDTLDLFADHVVRIKDKQNEKFVGYNVGFPYTRLSDNNTVGYEVRGLGGFKSKAAGTDSTNGAWVVDFSMDKSPQNKDYIFFAESAFDIMAFVQANKTKLDLQRSAFVSIGGTFSDAQIKGVMNYYSNAKAVDAFDNDFAGKVYGIRMLYILNEKRFEMLKRENEVLLKADDRVIKLKERDLTPQRVGRELGFSVKVDTWKAPQKFKDWNDFLMGKTIGVEVEGKNKFQQLANLQEKRKSLKL